MSINTDLRITDLEQRLAGGYQLLHALVGIRLRSVKDPESRRHLTWLSDVVAAMGLLNRRTISSGGVDFVAYLDDAATFWRRSVEDRGIRIELGAHAADLPASHALSAAIILHELVGNAVRHGFGPDHRGTIAIAWSRVASGVSLVVQDSGTGASKPTFGDGLQLVEGLVQHMSGTMVIDSSPGNGFGVRILLPIDTNRVH